MTMIDSRSGLDGGSGTVDCPDLSLAISSYAETSRSSLAASLWLSLDSLFVLIVVNVQG